MLSKILTSLAATSVPAIDNLPNSGTGVSSDYITTIIYWVLGAGGIIAVAVLVYAGIKYQLSQGDPAKTKQASQIIAFAVIGLIVIILATAITAFVTSMITEAAK